MKPSSRKDQKEKEYETMIVKIKPPCGIIKYVVAVKHPNGEILLTEDEHTTWEGARESLHNNWHEELKEMSKYTKEEKKWAKLFIEQNLPDWIKYPTGMLEENIEKQREQEREEIKKLIPENLIDPLKILGAYHEANLDFPPYLNIMVKIKSDDHEFRVYNHLKSNVMSPQEPDPSIPTAKFDNVTLNLAKDISKLLDGEIQICDNYEIRRRYLNVIIDNKFTIEIQSILMEAE